MARFGWPERSQALRLSGFERRLCPPCPPASTAKLRPLGVKPARQLDGPPHLSSQVRLALLAALESCSLRTYRPAGVRCMFPSPLSPSQRRSPSFPPFQVLPLFRAIVVRLRGTRRKSRGAQSAGRRHTASKRAG